MKQPMLAVIIPCYRVRNHVLDVIAGLGPEIDRIYVIDDKCPEQSGAYVQQHCKDDRLTVSFNEVNLGVGGACVAGYKQAMVDGADIVIKLDGDGQMDATKISKLIKPIIDGQADYTKGNRFYDLGFLEQMPRLRLFGNSVLSLVCKFASGYWDIVDPTNGFTAIHVKALRLLSLDKIEKHYFFESDMLFRLNTIRARVKDVPMPAVYADEESNLNILDVSLHFPMKYLSRMFKRIIYSYFLRDFNAGTVSLCLGLIMLIAGASYGFWKWWLSYTSGIPATSGEVMFSALPIYIGFQMLVMFATYDVQNVPRECLHVNL